MKQPLNFIKEAYTKATGKTFTDFNLITVAMVEDAMNEYIKAPAPPIPAEEILNKIIHDPSDSFLANYSDDVITCMEIYGNQQFQQGYIAGKNEPHN